MENKRTDLAWGAHGQEETDRFAKRPTPTEAREVSRATKLKAHDCHRPFSREARSDFQACKTVVSRC